MFDGKEKRIEPKMSWLTVNRKCNLRCRWCYAEGTNYQADEMSFQLAKELTLLSKKIGIEGMLPIGGEPTLWKFLPRYNHFCRELGMKSVLVTNALLFEDDEFWEEYQKSPNDKIGISLKAWNSQQFQKVAGSVAFEKMKKGVKRACDRFYCQTAITYNSFYRGNLPDMVQFAMDCGSKGVQINFCSTTFSNDKPDSAYMVSSRELAINIMDSYPELNRITEGKLVFEMMIPFCLFPSDFIEQLKERDQIISVCQLKKGKGLIWDERGNVLMCNALFDYPIGRYGTDFVDAESFKQWLNSKIVLGYYNRMGAYPSLKCKDCAMYQDCGGGCPLRWAVDCPEEIANPFVE
jgi:radical SAM protein with 4Fe4S-binding SPASM domain